MARKKAKIVETVYGGVADFNHVYDMTRAGHAVFVNGVTLAPYADGTLKIMVHEATVHLEEHPPVFRGAVCMPKSTALQLANLILQIYGETK